MEERKTRRSWRAPVVSSLMTSVSAATTSSTRPVKSRWPDTVAGVKSFQMRFFEFLPVRSAARSSGMEAPACAMLQSSTLASPALSSSAAIEPAGCSTTPKKLPLSAPLKCSLTSWLSRRASVKALASSAYGCALRSGAGGGLTPPSSPLLSPPAPPAAPPPSADRLSAMSRRHMNAAWMRVSDRSPSASSSPRGPLTYRVHASRTSAISLSLSSLPSPASPFRKPISAFSSVTCVFRRLITSSGSTSSFTYAEFSTSATRCAKRHVLMLSSVCGSSAEMVAIIAVLQLPPRLSRSTDVITLLRYGTNVPFFFFLSPSAMMHICRKCSELLMYFASRSTWPPLPVLCARSDPARSTRWNLDRRMTSLPCGRASMEMVKMQCEREEARFIGVSAMARLVSPRKSRFSASSSEDAMCIDRLRRCTLSSSSAINVTRGSSSRLFVSWLGSSRSYPASL
mmetsp:Transcript_15941/g.55606  ORF Transcript_15941/g.55606 Transcript_15941/m.55606 type:complete len:455 (+) Transcript_15941:749-2113(+)